MTNIKSLALAAVAALSLGVGSAMAQQSPQGSHTSGFPTHGQASSSAVDQPPACTPRAISASAAWHVAVGA
jgi:hypothetical protein